MDLLAHGLITESASQSQARQKYLRGVGGGGGGVGKGSEDFLITLNQRRIRRLGREQRSYNTLRFQYELKSASA